MNVRDFAPLPFFAGVGVVGLLVGTVVGQSGHGDVGGNADPMAGMNMGAGGGSAMSSSMPGMSMSSNATSTSAAAPGATMTMPDGSKMPDGSMPRNAMPMKMSDPDMAAAMPGGLHSSCSGEVCTVIFAPRATGVAKILGTTAKLDQAQVKEVVLTVGKKRLTLHQGKPVTDGKLRVELTAATSQEYTVRFSRTR
jgi:hypothetical protein